MRHRRSICFLVAISAVLLTVGCDKFGPNRPMAVDTGKVTKITPLSAVISGRAHLPGTTMTDLSFGVEYSTDDSFSYGNTLTRIASSAESDYSYSVIVPCLEPATTYYFRSFISQNGEIAYGKTGSFKTKEITSILKTLEVTEIGAASVTLNGYADVADCYFIAPLFMGSYGFRVEKDGKQLETLEGEPTIFVTGSISNNQYSYYLKTDPEANYTVTACLVSETRYPTTTPNTYSIGTGVYFSSETVSFRTKSIEASISLNEASEISSNQAQVSGMVSFPHWESAFRSTIYVYYSDTAATVEDLKSSGLSGAHLYYSYRPTDFWGILPDLQPDTQYYWTAVLDVNGVTFETEVKTFRTPE